MNNRQILERAIANAFGPGPQGDAQRRAMWARRQNPGVQTAPNWKQDPARPIVGINPPPLIGLPPVTPPTRGGASEFVPAGRMDAPDPNETPQDRARRVLEMLLETTRHRNDPRPPMHTLASPSAATPPRGGGRSGGSFRPPTKEELAKLPRDANGRVIWKRIPGINY